MKQYKRNKVDECNICLQVKQLSWDHVPPKSGIVLTAVEIDYVFKLLANRENKKTHISQNGVKYRTICSDCNSKIGSEYDPILNGFNEEVSRFLNSKLVLPRFTIIKTKPVRLIKAILAHIISAKKAIDEVTFDESVRKFIFSEIHTIPDDINIFFWVYPYDNSIIMRDFMIPQVPGDFQTFTFCHLLKYFPIAFIITQSPAFRGLESLTKYKHYGIDQEADIRIDLNSVEDYDWPERINESNIFIASAETHNAITVKPRRNNKSCKN